MITKIIEYFNQHPILKTGTSYSIWASAKSICTTFVGLAVMRWLSPDELGLWNTVSIFLAYTPFLQLGIQSGLNTELPVLLGKNDQVNAEARISNGYGYAIAISSILFLIGLPLSIYYLYEIGVKEFWGIITITVVSICSSFQLHFVARFRSAKAFERLTLLYKVDLPIIILCVWFIYRFGYWGILLYNCTTYIFDTIFMFLKMPFRELKPQIKKPVLFKMGKMGIAMMVLVQLKTASQTLPRWIILAKTNREKLGLYTPATAINGLINLIPNQIAQFFYPQMGYIYGKTGKARDMWPYVKKLLWLLPIIVLPFSLTIFFLSPWILETFFPKYTASLWAMRIMCIAFVFTSSVGLTWILNTLKAFKYSYFCSIVDFIGCFVYPYLCSTFLKYDILTSVTIGLLFNTMLNYIISIIILKRVLFLPKYN